MITNLTYRLKILPFLIITLMVCQSVYAVRIKDLAGIRGQRDNQLIGSGVVIGLNGTGDSPESFLARKPIINALERMAISMKPSDIKGRAIASVMVTATLPAFAKQGQRLDVVVSTVGDAISLRGGQLIVTPLRAHNRKVFAVAGGPVVGIPMGIELPAARSAIGAPDFAFDARRNIVPTVGYVVGGAIVEREIELDLNSRARFFLNLHQPDFTTSSRLAKIINKSLGDGSARSVDAGSVEISVPASYLGQATELISRIENLEIEPDAVARVVIDERTGTVVMGTNVRILPIAISYDNLSIRIGQEAEPQPAAVAGRPPQAPTEPEPAEENRVILFKGGVDIKEVVNGLNKIGISNADLLEVLKTVKKSGALQAELIIK
ncbi:MAG: flagellar basal body P-ring protein FlgI [Deltaproteobacteria bacterium]|nr:flagellar basal body P-ring protein FlgI [Deltaproteobacteria bacterium]MBT4638613.1 flagellar basal body P-ring protein FlgI [Deltaproteobacteria bacterium]MBT6503524.1 flagellar basal body P-ring protein FlgI [Deltaproteobacteria bacterium]MBT6611600.1 flagellar basal body P-ring protein FlgI [Deltaproteobacteria bacterium]MBT7152279.1 flagellar basal body P-ring protein FlgI [Deltaproteobacteria bacterium]